MHDGIYNLLLSFLMLLYRMDQKVCYTDRYIRWILDMTPPVAQRKMLVLVNGNKFKIDRQHHNSTSNFVSANSLIAKFIRYDASSIASLCVNASD